LFNPVVAVAVEQQVQGGMVEMVATQLLEWLAVADLVQY
jgi:hypothetical protein